MPVRVYFTPVVWNKKKEWNTHVIGVCHWQISRYSIIWCPPSEVAFESFLLVWPVIEFRKTKYFHRCDHLVTWLSCRTNWSCWENWSGHYIFDSPWLWSLLWSQAGQHLSPSSWLVCIHLLPRSVTFRCKVRGSAEVWTKNILILVPEIKSYEGHPSEYYPGLRRLNLGITMGSGLRPWIKATLCYVMSCYILWGLPVWRMLTSAVLAFLIICNMYDVVFGFGVQLIFLTWKTMH